MQEKGAIHQDPKGFIHWDVWDYFLQLHRTVILEWLYSTLYLILVQILPVHTHYVHTHSSYALDRAWSRGQQLSQQCRTGVIFVANQRIPTPLDHRTLHPQFNPREQDSAAEVEEEMDLLWTLCSKWVCAIKKPRHTGYRKERRPRPQLANSATSLQPCWLSPAFLAGHVWE